MHSHGNDLGNLPGQVYAGMPNAVGLTMLGHGMQGPVYVLGVSGGECMEDRSSGRVTCSQPAVTLVKTAGGCNLPYTGPSVVQAHTQAIRHAL